MKEFVMYGGCAVIGAITASCGFFWIKDNKFNPVGATVNIVCVVLWVLVIEFLFSNK